MRGFNLKVTNFKENIHCDVSYYCRSPRTESASRCPR